MPKAKRLPSGSYRCQVYAGKDAAGKRQYLSVTRPSRKEAEFEAAQLSMHHREVSRDTTMMTLSEAMEKYIQSKSAILSPSTIRGYHLTRKNHLQRLMDVRLNRLTPSMIQEAINQEAMPYQAPSGQIKTPSPKSVRNIHGLLSAVLSEYHPTFQPNTTLPQRTITEQTVLEPEQIGTLLRAVEGNEMEIPVLLAVWLCMRSSEITGLTWDCVDFRCKTVAVKQARVRNKDNQWVEKGTKTTSSTRTINAPDHIMNKLKEAKKTATGDHVVTIKGNCLYQRLKVILKRHNLPNIRFHDLRHTAASVMVLLNIPDKYAQKRGGWATPNTMRAVYQHTMAAKRNSVDEQIDRFFESLL